MYRGDYVKLKSEGGYDIVAIGMIGELVRLQLKKHRVDENSQEMRIIESKASKDEIEKFESYQQKEAKILERARTIALSLKLTLKLSDLEVRGDGKRVIFFYTAEQRVDFRSLIRQYADEFKMRIEMRQIGYREEASRLGGIGSCGRELCCTTWLTDFNMVSTQAARYQNLSINMLKLSGQCGKLKCCLNYELDTYIEANNEFPKQKTVKLDTQIGVAFSTKIDILKRIMWFVYEKQNTWIPLELSRVKQILALNKKGEKVPALLDEKVGSDTLNRAMANIEVEDMLAGSDLNRFDKKDKSPFKKDQPYGKKFIKKRFDAPQNRQAKPLGDKNAEPLEKKNFTGIKKKKFKKKPFNPPA